MTISNGNQAATKRNTTNDIDSLVTVTVQSQPLSMDYQTKIHTHADIAKLFSFLFKNKNNFLMAEKYGDKNRICLANSILHRQ